MLASPPLLPSDKVMEFTVTVFPVPTFLLLKVDDTDCPNVSDPIKPENDNVVVAVVLPLYVLFDALAEAVKAFLTIAAVVLDWLVTE